MSELKYALSNGNVYFSLSGNNLCNAEEIEKHIPNLMNLENIKKLLIALCFQYNQKNLYPVEINIDENQNIQTVIYDSTTQSN